VTRRQPQSMAVRHYQAVYGTPAPMSWTETAVAVGAVLAVAGPVAYLVVRALARLAIGVLR